MKAKINEIARISESATVDRAIDEYLSNTTLGNEFPYVRNSLRSPATEPLPV